METIQVVLDQKLLQATDKVARRLKRNRSALMRDAPGEHPAGSRRWRWMSRIGKVWEAPGSAG